MVGGGSCATGSPEAVQVPQFQAHMLLPSASQILQQIHGIAHTHAQPLVTASRPIHQERRYHFTGECCCPHLDTPNPMDRTPTHCACASATLWPEGGVVISDSCLKPDKDRRPWSSERADARWLNGECWLNGEWWDVSEEWAVRARLLLAGDIEPNPGPSLYLNALVRQAIRRATRRARRRARAYGLCQKFEKRRVRWGILASVRPTLSHPLRAHLERCRLCQNLKIRRSPAPHLEERMWNKSTHHDAASGTQIPRQNIAAGTSPREEQTETSRTNKGKDILERGKGVSSSWLPALKPARRGNMEPNPGPTTCAGNTRQAYDGG